MRSAVAWAPLSVVLLFACGGDDADPLFDKGNKAGTAGASAGTSGGSAGASGTTNVPAGGQGGTNEPGGAGGTVAAGSGGVDAAGGASTGAGAGGSGGEACVPETSPAAVVAANVVVVFDRSGSMDEALSGGQGITKWTVAKKGLASGLEATTVPVNVGFSLFPAGQFQEGMFAGCFLTPSTPACKALTEDAGCKDVAAAPDVAISPLAVARPQIVDLLADTMPKGGTPTRWALEYAWEHLRISPSEGERHVILVTDGQPQTTGKTNGDSTEAKACGTLPELAARTTEARVGTPSVKTHVIGSPGDIDKAILSGLALNGGTAKAGCTAANYQNQDCHYQLDSKTYAKGMENALVDIFSKITDRCLLVLPAGTDPAALNLTASTASGDVALVRDPSHTDGWDLESDTQVRVFGPTCQALTSATFARGCPTISAP